MIKYLFYIFLRKIKKIEIIDYLQKYIKNSFYYHKNGNNQFF